MTYIADAAPSLLRGLFATQRKFNLQYLEAGVDCNSFILLIDIVVPCKMSRRPDNEAAFERAFPPGRHERPPRTPPRAHESSTRGHEYPPRSYENSPRGADFPLRTHRSHEEVKKEHKHIIYL